jgi:hypothetical protein
MPLFDDRMIGCLANNPLIQPLRRWRGPREHGPPLTVEVSHDLVVRLRPEARRRDAMVMTIANKAATPTANKLAIPSTLSLGGRAS